MEVLLDTNFLISCIIKKIDFLEEFEKLGLKPTIPREVIEEMKDLKKNKRMTHAERIAIDLAIEIIEKEGLRKIRLPKGKVDDGLIAKGKEGYYIATLDNGIKREIPYKVTIASAQKGLQIERR